jgi:hypothetical protein
VKWDQPPNYPNIKNAFSEAIRIAQNELMNDLLQNNSGE